MKNKTGKNLLNTKFVFFTNRTIAPLTYFGCAVLGAVGMALAGLVLGEAGFGAFHSDHVTGGLLFVNSFVLFMAGFTRL